MKKILASISVKNYFPLIKEVWRLPSKASKAVYIFIDISSSLVRSFLPF
jgi:hypothetical protein